MSASIGKNGYYDDDGATTDYNKIKEDLNGAEDPNDIDVKNPWAYGRRRTSFNYKLIGLATLMSQYKKYGLCAYSLTN